MIWTIVRSPECSADILEAGYVVAPAVCEAVEAFALDGSGTLEPVGDGLMCLRASGGFALVRIIDGTKTIYVSRILANHPPRRVTPLLDEPIADDPSAD
jgi:hypothetical protein